MRATRAIDARALGWNRLDWAYATDIGTSRFNDRAQNGTR
jgi:hypothetical protein